MGKNIHGGSGHKKFGRKFSTASRNNNRLRVSEDDAEIYAIVTKSLGSCMFHCYCIDGTIRLGHIRGKFSGRSKRDNFVECGKWVLVGLREWDAESNVKSSKNKMQQCDLLEVYNDNDKHRLRDAIDVDWSILDANDLSRSSADEANLEDGLFGTERDFERDRLIQEMNAKTTERIVLEVDENSNEENVDIDDI